MRVIAGAAGRDLAALFSLVDDHVHLVASCDRRRAGRLAQGLVRSLGVLCGTRVDPARIRPVTARAHLQWLLKYVLTQTAKHGLAEHPALWTGSCFQDLAGARFLDGFELTTPQVLPRLRLRDVLPIVGLSPRPIEPATTDEIRAAGAARLVSAGAAALCAHPDLAARSAPIVNARKAVARLGTGSQIPTSELAFALRISPRSTRRLAHATVAPAALRAVAVRLSLEQRVLNLKGR